MTWYEQSLDEFLASPEEEVFCVSGPTRSGKTFLLQKYLSMRSDLVYRYTVGKKSLMRNKCVQSIQFFCKDCVIPNVYHKPMDVLILDDFHIHSLEKEVVLCAWATKRIPCRKLIILSSILTDYHLTWLETFTSSKKDAYRYHQLENSPYVHELGALKMEYRDYIADIKDEIVWDFNPQEFISQMSMCDMIDSILYDCGDEELDRNRVLVYLQSPEMCERISDYYQRNRKSIRVVTLHGQKNKKEIENALFVQNPHMILSTKIQMDVMDVSFASSISILIDFGLTYAINKYGFLTLGYCTQLEFMERSSIMTNGRIFRIVSREFFDSQPYAEPAIYDWKPFLLHCALENRLDFFTGLLYDSSTRRVPFMADIYRSVGELIRIHLLQHDYTLTHVRPNDHSLLQEMLRSPFQLQNYSIVLHLNRIHESSDLPEIVLILVIVLIALIDTVMKYGRSRVFYFAHVPYRTQRQMFDTWLRILVFCSGESLYSDNHFISNHHKFLWIVYELFLMLLVSPPSHVRAFNVHLRTWNQFLYRCKFLCRLLNVHKSNDGFMTFMKSKLSIHLSVRRWAIQKDMFPKYLFHNYSTIQRPSHHSQNPENLSPYGTQTKKCFLIDGKWRFLPPNIHKRTVEVLWKLVDYSPWVHNVHPHNRKMFFNDDLEEPSIIIHVDNHLHLPLPDDVVHYMNELQQSVQTATDRRHAHMDAKEKHRNAFQKYVVSEIENEVAYRPNKVKYLECQHHFEFYRQSLTTTSSL